jgi:PAS domain S-box-containing protein
MKEKGVSRVTMYTFIRKKFHTGVMPTVILFLIFGLITLGLFFKNNEEWNQSFSESVHILKNIKDVRYFVTEGHLWFDEMIAGDVLAGDKDVHMERVWEFFRKAESKIEDSLYTEKRGTSPDIKVISALSSLKNNIIELKEIMQERWKEADEAGPGSPREKVFDNLFAGTLNEINVIDKTVEGHIELNLLEQKSKYFNFLLIWLSVIISVSLILILLNKKRLAAEQKLLSANDELGMLNERLVSTNDKLETANQELATTNEEMEATNEELIGTNEEMEAMNEELVTSRDELVLEKNRVDAILDSIGDVISIQDTEYNIVYINKVCKDHFGQDIVGRKCYNIYEKRDQVCDGCPVEESFETGTLARATRIGIDKDGNEISFDITASPIKNEKGEVVNVIELAKDVTKKVSEAKEREMLINKLEHANKELDDFAHTVSHDLKAPLRGITSLANWIEKDYEDKFDKDDREKLHLLVNRTKRMHNLINGVLRYSRIGRVTEGSVEINLNDLVQEVLDMISVPDNVDIDIQSGLPTLFCKVTNMRQLFLNLFSNAVKYIDKEIGKVKLKCVSYDGGWQFSISDNGIGIYEKDFEKIFNVFHTVASPEEATSCGVGLSIAKKAIENCGGTIWVESKVGEGSTFHFTVLKVCGKKGEDNEHKNFTG